MLTEKYLYFRVGTAAASEDDEATGSNVYPASHLMGMTSGTADGNGAVTDDDNALSLYLKPIRRIAGEIEADAGDGDPDVLVLACAQYGQKAVMKNILAAINGKHANEDFITLFDGYVDIAAGESTGIPGVTGLTVVAAQVAED